MKRTTTNKEKHNDQDEQKVQRPRRTKSTTTMTNKKHNDQDERKER